MEKESLVHSLDFIEKIFQSFFDFNTIFTPNGDGKVALHIEYLKESQIKIANKISFLKTFVEEQEKNKLEDFDISSIIKIIESKDFKSTHSEQILTVMNQLALKSKNFQERKEHFLSNSK